MKPTEYRAGWLDQVIGYISPEIGLRRARARVALEMVRRYDAAALGRRTDGWGARGTSANAEVQIGLVNMRDRSRELARNNPWASRAIAAVANKTISYGFTAKIEAPLDIKKRFNLWAATTRCDADARNNLAGIMLLAMRTVVESGEVLIRRRVRRDQDKLPVPLQLQVIEADYLDHGKTEMLAGGGRIVQGVQFGPFGNREGYWLFADHPGDLIGNVASSTFVAAADVIHMYRSDRPGQVRGVPWLHSVMLTLRDLDDYEDAYLLLQKMAACQVGVVKDNLQGGLTPGATTAMPALGERMEPGRFDFLPAGKDIAFNNPVPAGEYGPFVKSILLRVAAAVGITYQALTGDLQSMSFSSGRLGRIEESNNVDAWRWNMIVPQGYDVIARWFAEAATLVTPVSNPDLIVISWTAPRREMINPAQEIPAYRDSIRSGIQSLPDVHRELGGDSDAILDEIKATNDKLDNMKLVLDSDPRKVSQAGLVQTAPVDPQP